MYNIKKMWGGSTKRHRKDIDFAEYNRRETWKVLLNWLDVADLKVLRLTSSWLNKLIQTHHVYFERFRFIVNLTLLNNPKFIEILPMIESIWIGDDDPAILPKLLSFQNYRIVDILFGFDFNQEVSGGLPDSLTHLTFSRNYPLHLCAGLPDFTVYE